MSNNSVNRKMRDYYENNKDHVRTLRLKKKIDRGENVRITTLQKYGLVEYAKKKGVDVTYVEVNKMSGKVVSKGVRKQALCDYLRRRGLCKTSSEATAYLNTIEWKREPEVQTSKLKVQTSNLDEGKLLTSIDKLEKRLAKLEQFHETQKQEAVKQLERLLTKIKNDPEEPLEQV